jgi:tripartite-type tricarboxylate transporter receptor subunit TctC
MIRASCPADGSGSWCQVQVNPEAVMKRFAFALLFLLASVSNLQAQAPFYQGKTIRIVVGTGSGGTIDAARIIAQHLGKYIPGNPSVIVQSMPGGAHIVATNYVFNVARPDGLTLLAGNPNVAIAQLIKVDGVRFDVRKFEWLGSSGSDSVVMTIRADLPYNTFEEMRKAGRELRVGSTGPGSNAHDFPMLLKEFAGANFKFVSGYPASTDILLGLERKEVDIWAGFAAAVRPVVQRGTVRPLVRARVSSPGFEHLPVDETLTVDPLGKMLMSIKTAPLAVGRVLAATPGIPADRTAILREAIANVLADPEVGALARKAQIDFKPIPGGEVRKGMTTIVQQTPEARQVMIKYIRF